MLFRNVLFTVFLVSIGIPPLFAQVDSCPTGTSTPNTDESGFIPECVGRVPYSGECPPGFNKYPLNGFGYYCYAALTHCPSGYVLGKTKKNPVDGCYHRGDLNSELGREAVTEQLADEVERGNVSTPAAKQLKAIEDVFQQQEASFCAHGVADCRRIFLNNLEYRSITLNPLGETGVIITNVPNVCAGACSMLFVLRKVGQGYEKVLEGGGGHVESGSTVTNGLYDILVSEPKTKTMYDFLGVPSNQEAAKSIKYIWTGSRYALTTQEQAERNPNASHPSFQGELSLFGLHGGQSKSEVLKVLGKSNEAACRFDQSDYTTKCTFINGSFGWSVDFYENRLGSYRVTFPANDWNQQVASIKASLHAEPTDIESNTSELLMTWKSTETVPCAADAAKKCPAEIVLLNTNSKESEATINYMYLPVENKVIKDETHRAMSKYH